VICIDRDLSSFNANLKRQFRFVRTLGMKLVPKKVDLVKDPWPFDRIVLEESSMLTS